MDRHVLLKLLLSIVLLLSFALCTLSCDPFFPVSLVPGPGPGPGPATAPAPIPISLYPARNPRLAAAFGFPHRTPAFRLPHRTFTPFAKITPSTRVSHRRLNFIGKIAITIAVIAVSLVILKAVLKALKKAPHNDNGYDLGRGTEIRKHTVEEHKCLEVGIDIRTYTIEELANATNNFTTKVGEGASGFVYRANLEGDTMGAVKRAMDLDPSLFKQELSALLRLPCHPHLVGERISNGNLHDRLHKNKGLTSPLSWVARMDIAYQVAVALQYLHDEAKPPILHRDVKSANILLVNDNCAKLADFGLSKLGPKNNQFTMTAVRGSYGYMDPQYVKTRRYSAKSDVYSFGVLLLELLTGFRSLHYGTPLAEWTQTYRSEGIERFITIVDPNMRDHINMMELRNMMEIANLCLRDVSEERSSMREIVYLMQENRNINANGNLSHKGEVSSLRN